MRVLGLVLLAVAVSGCSHSRYANDPRAAVVGPAYLDYIADYPRDCATEYYYPTFRLEDASKPPVEPVFVTTPSAIDVLLIQRPPESDQVRSEAGEGFPHLESRGIWLFTRATE